jgi:hypothetical protein
MTLTETLKRARQVSVPLLFPETSDPAATIELSKRAINGKGASSPMISFDRVRGFLAMNEQGDAFLRSIGSEEGPGIGEYLSRMSIPKNLDPASGVLFWHQPDWTDPVIVQGIWLLRDAFKARGWTWIGLAPSASLPPQLRLDVVVVPEVYPNKAEIVSIIDRIVDSANSAARKNSSPEIAMSAPDRDEIARSLRGLNAFSVEQGVSLNLSRSGIDPKGCWSFKLNTVRQTQGCELSINNPTFADLAGVSQAKEFMGNIIRGKKPVDVILQLDEGEKMFAGQGTDSSGVSTKMAGQFLTGTQERKWKGIILTGVPGSGKTWTSLCCAGEARAVFLKVSISEMQSSLVGSSEANMKSMFAMADALGENVFMIMTCNNMASLTPEIVARFRMGTFFYDYPDDEERGALWKLYMGKYALANQSVPPSLNWVGREIESACEKADIMNRPLSEVARFVVPQSIGQRAKLEEIRNMAAGRYLSASYPGLFQANRIGTSSDSGRVININA